MRENYLASLRLLVIIYFDKNYAEEIKLNTYFARYMPSVDLLNLHNKSIL